MSVGRVLDLVAEEAARARAEQIEAGVVKYLRHTMPARLDFLITRPRLLRIYFWLRPSRKPAITYLPDGDVVVSDP